MKRMLSPRQHKPKKTWVRCTSFSTETRDPWFFSINSIEIDFAPQGWVGGGQNLFWQGLAAHGTRDQTFKASSSHSSSSIQTKTTSFKSKETSFAKQIHNANSMCYPPGNYGRHNLVSFVSTIQLHHNRLTTNQTASQQAHDKHRSGDLPICAHLYQLTKTKGWRTINHPHIRMRIHNLRGSTKKRCVMYTHTHGNHLFQAKHVTVFTNYSSSCALYIPHTQ